MIVTGTTIFWSALLLFVVQPLIARKLLPWFGGSPTVWIVSLLFFQAVLFAGYVYAHLSSRYLDARRQSLLHGALLVLAFLFLPIYPAEPVDAASSNPTTTILWILVASLGLPLVTLSATNPLLQRWVSRTVGEADGSSVYRLFALSNLGSLLGLWSYPFLLEPWTTVAFQLRAWSVGYVVFALFATVCALRAARVNATPTAGTPRTKETAAWAEGDVLERVMWLGLSATGSILLMATSNQLTRNVAAVPFLWVLPLSLYLLSFIVSFEHDRWYARWLWAPLFVGSLLGVLQLLAEDTEPDLYLQFVVYSVNLLSGCMVCHGELARRRPRTERLTSFYLYVAAGGVLGGTLVSLVAPEIFDGYWEYPVGLAAVYLLGGSAMAFAGRHRLYWLGGGVALVVLVGSYVRLHSVGALTMRRSFFGVVRVYEHSRDTENWRRYLWNGPIAHGGQFLAPGRRQTPILYYGRQTGVGLALRYGEAEQDRRIAVLGLGTGSVVLFGRAGDQWRFYEINTDVVDVAREYFYYLEDTPAAVAIATGDGRLLLERELRERGSLELDILIVDAFNGDAIPVHLLTEEAFAVYEQHLAPDGILAIHVSNLHFDLKPVIRARAEAMNLVAVLVESDADEERGLFVSDWMLVTANGEFLSDPELQSLWTPRRADVATRLEDFLWTDDFSNLFRSLR